MRETLYFKDDDARLSFLQGNYITLTNMSDRDIDKVIQYRLSPINISFQTMNPKLRCKMLTNRFAGEALKKATGYELYESGAYSTGSTDMGDLSCIMPVIHPYTPGAVGTAHGADYYIENPELACVGSAKWQLEMLRLLLSDGAEKAKKIVLEYKPLFASKEEYFEYIDKFTSDGDRITYAEGCAEIKL